jgi:hypothetical protein
VDNGLIVRPARPPTGRIVWHPKERLLLILRRTHLCLTSV